VLIHTLYDKLNYDFLRDYVVTIFGGKIKNVCLAGSSGCLP